MILREFFRDYLYNQDYGYFHEGPVHISEPLQFKQMFGESAYVLGRFLAPVAAFWTDYLLQVQKGVV